MAKKKKLPATKPTTPEQTRLWLMYPPIGIVCLELDGPRAEVKAAIKWLEKHGVSVEPVEINVIES